MNINKNSWHYKLVAKDRCTWEMPQNLCSYMRSLIFRSLVVIALCLVGSAIGGAVLYCTADAVAWLFAMLMSWSFIPPNQEAVVGLILPTCAIFVGSSILIRIGVNKFHYSGKLIAFPSAITEIYNSTFGKACYPIMYKDDK